MNTVKRIFTFLFIATGFVMIMCTYVIKEIPQYFILLYNSVMFLLLGANQLKENRKSILGYACVVLSPFCAYLGVEEIAVVL
ncbi:hypothetical protein [Halobacillus sp. K22]|uniref:hypothetical protein n=1 Tax=Halobacillus sp. K22 TaxID=3457431 RepID=UPI003FCD87C4